MTWNKRNRIFNVVLIAILAVSLFGSVTPARAAGIVVDTNNDVFDVAGETCGSVMITHLPGTDGVTSLREAICAANNAAGADEITFAGNYTITLGGSRLPVIDGDLTITGNGAANTIIQASACDPTPYNDNSCTHNHNVMLVEYADLTLNDLTVRHGVCLNPGCLSDGLPAGNGGGIVAHFGSSLFLYGVTVTDNYAQYGGAIFMQQGTVTIDDGSIIENNEAGLNGGGISAATGTVYLQGQSVVRNNEAGNYGGGIFGSDFEAILVNDSEISGNIADKNGGGIAAYFNSGLVELDNGSLIDNNTAGEAGGGIYVYAVNLDIFGGSVVSNNTAGTSGGGIFTEYSFMDFEDVEVTGNTAYNLGGGMYILEGEFQMVSGLVYQNDSETGAGGGIVLDNLVPATIDNSTIDDNTAGSTVDSNHPLAVGGGVYISGGDTEIYETTISNNTASEGGGLYAGEYDSGDEGFPVNSVWLQQSTVNGNTATNRGGGLAYVSYSDDGQTIINSTITGNESEQSYGGGIVVFGSDVEIVNSTIVYNESFNDGAGLDVDGLVAVRNTIIAHNIGDNCFDVGIGDAGGNLTDDDTCGFTNAAAFDSSDAAFLGPLADNGGRTLTHALLPGHPGIDTAVGNGGGTCDPSYDQRDINRPYNGVGAIDDPEDDDCDVGAYEYAPLLVYDVYCDGMDLVFSVTAGVGSAFYTKVTYPDGLGGPLKAGTIPGTVTYVGDSYGTWTDIQLTDENGVTYYVDDITCEEPLVEEELVLVTVVNTQDGGDGILSYNEILTTGVSEFVVSFNQDVLGADDVTNYMLYDQGSNLGFDTVDCAGGVLPDDVAIPVNIASYNSATFEATITVNNGLPLPNGAYRLQVCGTTSVTSLLGTELAGDGTNSGTDYVHPFFVVDPRGSGGGNNGGGGGSSSSLPADSLPATGFAPGMLTELGIQPLEKMYTAYTELWLNIPSLGVTMDILGVPQVAGEWDVTWLGNSAGYLEGTAFPTWAGNTALTGHVWDANNNPGPFANLKDLQHGDIIEIHAYGYIYTYEVRTNLKIRPWSTSVLGHSDYDLLTLLTCESWSEYSDSYRYRRAVQAVLISVTAE